MAFSISANGANQTVYISEISGTKYYNINNGTNLQITSFPIQITNSNPTPTSNILKVLFTTNLTINNNSLYFQPLTDGIQFGSTSLNSDGSKPSMTVTVDNYDGFIFNGDNSNNGKNYIYVYNLTIDGTGRATQIGAGWLGLKYYGKGTTNNYIINCSSKGTINGGGLLGDYAENVTLIGCSSSGTIGTNAGGIVGGAVTSVTLKYCYSTGIISGDGAGGIIGSNTVSADVQNCYSEGNMTGNNTGGIVGSNAGSTSVTISNCYSRGTIQGSNSGGIIGSFGLGSYTATVINCYSIGNINSSQQAGGICGLIFQANSVTISNCYVVGTVNSSTGYIIGNVSATSGFSSPYVLTNNYSEAKTGTPGTWSSTNANLALTGNPSGGIIGVTWVSVISGTPYELNNFGYTPYSTDIISSNALVKSVSQTVEAGSTSLAGLVSASNSYSILSISGGNSDSYNTIAINSTTGGISTSTSTAGGTYTIIIRRTGSYFITTFSLTVNPYISPTTDTTCYSCCITTSNIKYPSYEVKNNISYGNGLVADRANNIRFKFSSYADYMYYLMAQSTKY